MVKASHAGMGKVPLVTSKQSLYVRKQRLPGTPVEMALNYAIQHICKYNPPNISTPFAPAPMNLITNLPSINGNPMNHKPHETKVHVVQWVRLKVMHAVSSCAVADFANRNWSWHPFSSISATGR